MRITYDPEANAVYIELRRGRGADSIDLEDGVTAVLDAEGHVLGLEVLDARERLGRNPLQVSLEELKPERAARAPGMPARITPRPGGGQAHQASSGDRAQTDEAKSGT